MKVNCGNCTYQFEFRINTETIDNIDIVYVECPECNHRYLSYVQDKEVEVELEKTMTQYRLSQSKNLTYFQQRKAYHQHKSLVKSNRELQERKKVEYKHLIDQVIK